MLECHRIEAVAVQVALHADSSDGHAHRLQVSNVLHVVVEPVAGQDVVIVDEQPGVWISLFDPQRHLPDELRSQALRKVVGMDHLVVEVILGKAAAIAGSDRSRALLHRQSHLIVRERHEPFLNVIRNAPKEAVAAQGNPLLIGPSEHGVHDGVVDVASFAFHGVPLEVTLDDPRVEMRSEDGLEFGDVFRAGLSGEDRAGRVAPNQNSWRICSTLTLAPGVVLTTSVPIRCLAIEESRSASAAYRLAPQRDRWRRDTPVWSPMAATVYHPEHPPPKGGGLGFD
jgi:hypothetical protein